jgi:hypothetical protein
VFARSPFEYSHDPDACVVDAGAFVLIVLHPALAAVVLLPPQAATSNPAATSSAARRVVRVLGLVGIGLIAN